MGQSGVIKIWGCAGDEYFSRHVPYYDAFRANGEEFVITNSDEVPGMFVATHRKTGFCLKVCFVSVEVCRVESYNYVMERDIRELYGAISEAKLERFKGRLYQFVKKNTGIKIKKLLPC